jgi:hypothetical protein
MKALITDTIKFTFFTTMVAAFAGVGTAITKVLGLVPHQAHRAR